MHPIMAPLETVIGYKFRNPLILAEALTHASLAYESQKPHFDNQRLEFLGDAVLQLALSELLYKQLRHADEGTLTKTRAQLVSAKALARLARSMQLGSYILMGRGEEANGGRDRESTLADALEALAGAIFLDGGLSAAAAFVDKVFASAIAETGAGQADLNPKGQLQEMLQAVANAPPSYEIASESGPDHQKSFEAVVSWQSRELGRGTGKSKKEAEIEAARQALGNPDLRALIDAGPASDPSTVEFAE